MRLSIVIPAFNEEQLILDCLNSIQESIRSNLESGFTYEIIVVDNNSTDETAQLATQAGATVVFEPIEVVTLDWTVFPIF
ncbi:glycosyltransferase [uncultured Nitrosomonas sp.]|uniref:glycosyltransferase family 2 protein n=1 Tax=uncultured Nitrosomonas sp. TaxID=156424 RepID=UPI0025E3A5BC|nr:glycosyltransferase [uncultured Nitrosomonas sp.]